MKSIIRAAFAAAFLGSAAVIAAPASAADTPKLTRDVQNDLAAAQKAMQGNDYATAMGKIKDAQGVSGLTDYDNYMINTFLAQVYIQQKDYTNATAPMEAAADSPAIPDDQKKSTYFNAFQLALAAKHFDKAIRYGQQLQAMNAIDAKGLGELAQAYYLTKDYAHAQDAAQKSIDASKAAGQPPSELALDIVMSSEANQNNQAGAQQTLEQLAIGYNKPEDWGQLIDVALSGKNVKDADALYLLRLKMLIPGAMRPEDYPALASVADSQSYATEAYNVLQKGLATGKMDTARASTTLTHSKAGAAIDQKELPQIAAAAAKSKSGEQDIKLAEDYWGYGRFAEAEAAARRAIGKGGLKDPSEGPTLLGMILVAQGKYDEAVQTLAQVNGTPSRKNTAHLWTIYAQAQKPKSQAPATPAPTQQQ